MKKIIFSAFALAVTLALMTAQPAMAQTLYENKVVTEVYKGLSYERSQRITAQGPLDVHVLTIDMRSEHLEVKPLVSTTEHGLKEVMSKLVDTNGAVAGVNGDFFGMSGEYSAPFGVEVIDGKLTNASEGFNSAALKSATLFINDQKSPFIEYVKTELKFFNNGVESLNLYAHNRVTDAILPFYIDRNAYITTTGLDARFPNLYKIVVEDGFITYISKAGETVTVPENGYIVVINEGTANYHLSKYAVGQTAEVKLSSAIDLTKIDAAISGGGKILSDGYYADGGNIVAGRHPRTAIGITADRSKLMLMVVDGRGGSVGVTHGELAGLLIEYGAYNAMHLDGGGSSTMVVKDNVWPAVKNTPSDGAERKVVNGLGVFNNSTPSETEALAITMDDLVVKGIPVRMRVYGLDKYLNKSELTEGFTVDAGDGGSYADGYFYPSRTGSITVTASYDGFTASKQVRSAELAQINPVKDIKMALNGEYQLSLAGKTEDSYSVTLNAKGVNVEVVPSELAAYADGKLTGRSAGTGYVKLSAGNIQRYVRLTVGTRDVLVEAFEPKASGISYTSYPEGNSGHVAYSGEIAVEGSSLELAYSMKAATSTQASYAVFDPPLEISGSPTGLKLTVYSDNSNNWLRGRIKDANGAFHTIDFARYIDWEGFKTVEAVIPAEAVYPIALDRVYVASLENTNEELSRIYIDNLKAVYPIDSAAVALPASTEFTDKKRVELGAGQAGTYTDITLIGDITSALKINNYQDIQNKNKAEFNKKYDAKSNFGLFIGKTDNIAANMPAFKWTASYDSYKLGDVNVINLVASKGNLYSSNQSQWQRIQGDLNSAGSNVLVIIDKNPQTALPKKELSLLHNLFVKTGKNIIVVSADGTASGATVTDGVRYVNLGALFTGDGAVNKDFRTLRVRFLSDDIRYSLK